MNTDDRLELIRRYQCGEASAEEVRQLEEFLKSDPEWRAEYLASSRLDVALAVAARTPSAPQLPAGPARPRAWPAWRPITAAAAGLLLGVLSASVAWALAAPQTGYQRILPILDESFEDDEFRPERGFPNRAGVWAGDLSNGISEELRVVPRSGQRMVRLAPHAVRKFSYATKIIDLADYPLTPSNTLCRVEVEASFHNSAFEGTSRHQIRLAAFAEAPADVKAIWTKGDLLESVLSHVGRTVSVEPGAEGWHALRSSMEIPPGTRSLVISIAAASADEAAPKPVRYLDDVRARFVIHDAAR